MSTIGTAGQTLQPARREAPAGRTKQPWQLTLFKRSLKKRETLSAILKHLPDVQGRKCLEIGCATGVTSYFLRQRGGQWTSVDFEADHVASTRSLVGENVQQVDEKTLPFADGEFDVLVGINFLEHIHDDEAYLREMVRVLKPGGRLLLTGPRGETHRLLFKSKRLMGLTCDSGGFGHARDGYPPQRVREMFAAAGLTIDTLSSYCRVVTEGVEDVLNYVYHKLSTRKKAKAVEAERGDFHGETSPMSEDAFRKVGLAYRAYSVAYPILRLVTWTDKLLPFTDGYMFVVTATRQSDQAASR